jgi:hypothetical protein
MQAETVFDWFPRGLVPKLHAIDRSAGLAVTGYISDISPFAFNSFIEFNPAVIFRYKTLPYRVYESVDEGKYTLRFPFEDVPVGEDGFGTVSYLTADITSSLNAHTKRMHRELHPRLGQVDQKIDKLFAKYLDLGSRLPEPPVQPYQIVFPGCKPVRKRFLIPKDEPSHFAPTVEHLLKVREMHKRIRD